MGATWSFDGLVGLKKGEGSCWMPSMWTEIGVAPRVRGCESLELRSGRRSQVTTDAEVRRRAAVEAAERAKRGICRGREGGLPDNDIRIVAGSKVSDSVIHPKGLRGGWRKKKTR